MPYQNLVLLAPCHGLEDFPLYHTGEDAASMLACWTALWHPYLLANANRLPRVERCDYPPDQLANSLFVLPKPCELELASELPEEIAAAGSALIRDETTSRKLILEAALKGTTPNIDEELIRDFLAFGFTLLQVELLTQQMRYGSSIDESRIERLVFDAASMAAEGNVEGSREKLTACHDALTDERSHFYPVDVYLLDLTVLSPEVLHPSLVQHFQDPTPQNILASGECVEQLRKTYPESADAFQQGIEEGRIGIAGGEYHELPLPLVSPNSFAQQIQQGSAAWRESLGVAPTVFARRRAGIFPGLAHGIRNAGMDSALHLKLDEGRYPDTAQSKTKWSSAGRPIIDCLARQPLNANADHTFLDLPRELSDAMDTDFVAVRAFWHWPGHVVPWYQDLRRAARFGTALGKFVTLQEFFEESAEPQSNESFATSAYRYPFLTQACKNSDRTPISTWVDYWKRTTRTMSLRGAHAMTQLLGTPDSNQYEQRLTDREKQIDQCSRPGGEQMDERTAQGGELVEQLDHELGRVLVESNADSESGAAKKTVVNPLAFPRRIMLRGCSGQGAAVYASEGSGPDARTLIDVPGMGFATFETGEVQTMEGPNLAEELTLRNEFFQAEIDGVTGSLRSFRDYSSRTTRLSQQVGLRITLPKTGQHWVDRQAPVGYSIMAADKTSITANGKVFAEITAVGRMLAPNGDTVGEFRQRFQVTRGSRVLSLEIEIQPHKDLLLEDEPWDSYYASRFAFGDESAIFVAGRHLQGVDVATRRFEAPLFVGIDCAGKTTTVLTGGVPYHRRAADRQLDSILISAGETATNFRLGIAADLPTPVKSAVDWMEEGNGQPIVLDGAAQAAQGWLIHISARNVIASGIWSIPRGVKLRLIETEGRGTKFRVQAFRKWKLLKKLGLGEPIEMNDDGAVVSLAPYEIAEFQGEFE